MKNKKSFPLLMSVAMITQTITPAVSALTSTDYILSQVSTLSSETSEAMEDVEVSNAISEQSASTSNVGVVIAETPAANDGSLTLKRDLLLDSESESSLAGSITPFSASTYSAASTYSSVPAITYNYDSYTTMTGNPSISGTTMSGLVFDARNENCQLDKITITTGGETKVFTSEWTYASFSNGVVVYSTWENGVATLEVRNVSADVSIYSSGSTYVAPVTTNTVLCTTDNYTMHTFFDGTVNRGESVTFTVYPRDGYEIDYISVNITVYMAISVLSKDNTSMKVNDSEIATQWNDDGTVVVRVDNLSDNLTIGGYSKKIESYTLNVTTDSNSNASVTEEELTVDSTKTIIVTPDTGL